MGLLTFDAASPDITTQLQHQREYWGRSYPLVKLMRIDRDSTQVDELYFEALERRFQDPVDIKAQIEQNPSRQTLRKFGLIQPREIIFSFSTLLLDDAGLLEDSSTFLIGDLVQWDGDTYEILEQHRPNESYWLATNIPLWFACTCNTYQRGR
jgi:hypothetical protein